MPPLPDDRTRSGPFTTRVIADRAKFEALRPEWNALADRTGVPPMMRHEWLSAAADAFARGDLAVFLVRDGEGLRAAAPLVVNRIGPVQRLDWLSWQSEEPETPLYDDLDALDALWAAIRAYGLPVVLRRLDLQGAALERVRGARPMGGGCLLSPESSRTAAAPLTGDWAAFEGAISANGRSELRRKRKGLEKHGPVEFRALAPDADAMPPLLEELLRVEAAGWKSRTRTAVVFRPDLRTFLWDYARRSAACGELRLCFLTVGGETVAAQMLIAAAGRLWQYKIGYDERWAKYSPGRLLMFDILRWANAEGFEAVEYLGQSGEWQSRWPAAFKTQSLLRFYPATLNAGAAFTADSARFLLRRAQSARAAASRRAVAGPAEASA